MRSIEAILDSAAEGVRVSSEEAERLFEEADLLDLASCADRIRQRLHPDNVISYIIDRNINYTNVCKEFCTFCAFYRVKGDAEAYVLPDHVIYKKIEETLALGGTGILMQGGVHPDLKIDYYERLLVRNQRAIQNSLPLFFAAGNSEHREGLEAERAGSVRPTEGSRSGFDAGRWRRNPGR